jgi:3-methyladenine DNA glycosylase AlkC
LNDPYQGTKLKDLMNKWDQAQATEYIMKYINKYQVEQMVTMGAWSEKIVKRLWRSGGLL